MDTAQVRKKYMQFSIPAIRKGVRYVLKEAVEKRPAKPRSKVTL